MPLKPLFHPFNILIEDCFSKAKADAGTSASALALEIEEEPRIRGSARAQFLVVEPAGPVRTTWNGIASLWVFCQGSGRVGRRMFEAKRAGKKGLYVSGDRELERGVDSLELARRLCSTDAPADVAWPDWAPPISPNPAKGSDDATGNALFLGALGWIFRHEIAHVTLNHAFRQLSESLTPIQCEEEADQQATKWYRGNSSVD